nr:hypothetical protein CFP56_19666 [Quercus suber]
MVDQATNPAEMGIPPDPTDENVQTEHEPKHSEAEGGQPPTVMQVCTSKRDKKLEFGDLGIEVKAIIVEKLIRPTDLKNVCLVNKQLHELAVKPLYRQIALDLGSPNDNRLSAFLNPRNIGLKHIKRIRLYLANVPDRRNQKQQADFATRMLLEFLPEDVLEEFR